MVRFSMVFEEVRLLHEPFSPQEYIEKTANYTITKGGVASFTGYDRAEGRTEALELSHYEPLTQPGMEDLSWKAQQRFELKALTIIHRVGLMRPGEPIVCVSAAARHRRGAIEAVDYCMDHLKSAAWFWKRELKNGEWTWIEPREEDHADLARWR